MILAVVRPAFVRTVPLHEVGGPPRQRLANWRILRGTGFGQPPTKQVKEALARDQQSRNHDAGDMQCHADLYRLSPIHSGDQDLKRVVRTAVEVLDSENTLSVIGLWLGHGGKHNGVGVVVVRHMPWQRCPRSTLRAVPNGMPEEYAVGATARATTSAGTPRGFRPDCGEPPGPATKRNWPPSRPGGCWWQRLAGCRGGLRRLLGREGELRAHPAADLERRFSRHAAGQLVHPRDGKTGGLLRGGGVGDLAYVGLLVTSISP